MPAVTFDAVFYTLAFIVPGFVIHETFAALVPVGAYNSERQFLRYLTASVANYAVWVWLVFLILKHPFFTASPTRSAIAWFVIILPGPVALGALLARLSQEGTIRRMLEKVGLVPVHPIPTAWDWAFCGRRECWVVVTLADGSWVGGIFGRESFASSDVAERDLYLQRAYRIDEGGTWHALPATQGIYLRGDQIRYIEFFGEQEAADG